MDIRNTNITIEETPWGFHLVYAEGTAGVAYAASRTSEVALGAAAACSVWGEFFTRDWEPGCKDSPLACGFSRTDVVNKFRRMEKMWTLQICDVEPGVAYAAIDFLDRHNGASSTDLFAYLFLGEEWSRDESLAGVRECERRGWVNGAIDAT